MWPEFPDPGHLIKNACVTVGSFAVMCVLFCEGWKLSERRIWRFKGFSDTAKAEWSARIVSTVHAAIVCPLVVACLVTMQFDSVTLVPKGPTTLLETTFSVAIGFFIFDLMVVLWWMMPMWTAFVVHHVVMVTPYIYCQFLYVCTAGQYVFLLVLLFELSTIPLNVMAFLADLGLRHTKSHIVTHVTMYLTWFFCRVLLPIYLIFLLWTRVVKHFHEEEACVVPALMFVPVAATFCITIFVFVLTPRLYSRLRCFARDEAGIVTAFPCVESREDSAVTEREVGPSAGGSRGGNYHSLDSVGTMPTVPRGPGCEDMASVENGSSVLPGTHNRMTAAGSIAPSHGVDFREELLPARQRYRDDYSGAEAETDRAVL